MMPRFRDGLSPKQTRFIEEYLVDLNASQAALRAGYSAQTAFRSGVENLQKPAIKSALAEAQARRAERVGITQAQMLAEWGLVSFSDVRHYVIDNQGNVQLAEGAPDCAMRAISSIKKKTIPLGEGKVAYETEIRLWNKPAALKMAGEHLGMFEENKKKAGAAQATNDSFLTFIQIVQQHGLTSRIGAERFCDVPGETPGHLLNTEGTR
jgi:phage terminase small subunit